MRPVRQISGNLQEFQAAISELTDAVGGSVRITGNPEVINLFFELVPTNALVSTEAINSWIVAYSEVEPEGFPFAAG